MKKVLYVIIGLALVYLLLCLIGPSTIVVERSKNIKAPASVIKGIVGNYNQFKDWSPWQEKDPGMKISVEGEAGKPGHKYSWEGNKQVGKGTMQLLSIGATDTDSLVEELTFDGRGTSKVYFVFTPSDSGTSVIWGMNMHVGFGGRAIMLFMKGKMDQMLGGDFEKGLDNLSALAQKVAADDAPVYEIKELSWDAKTYYGKKETLGFDKLSNFFAENFPKIFKDAQSAKAEMAGPPSAIFFTYDEEKKEANCAAVASIAKGEIKGWEKFDVPAGKVLQIEYFGSYDKMAAPHMAMDKYIKEKGLTQGWVIEEYVTDPMNEKDTAKWQTNIYYLVK